MSRRWPATRYRLDDIGAAIASGSFKTLGMIVAPCSVRTMSEISTGVTSSLLTRAADTMLKERRRLVLMVRETPLHTGHLRTMTQLSEIGAIIAPLVPARLMPSLASIDEMVTQTAARMLDLFGLEGARHAALGRGPEGRPSQPRSQIAGQTTQMTEREERELRETLAKLKESIAISTWRSMRWRKRRAPTTCRSSG